MEVQSVLREHMHAYSQFGSNEVFLCKCYIEANEKSTALDKDSKQQTLVHEWTHVYANTYDVDRAYGTEGCITLAENDADEATNNADNYGYTFIAILWNSYHN